MHLSSKSPRFPLLAVFALCALNGTAWSLASQPEVLESDAQTQRPVWVYLKPKGHQYGPHAQQVLQSRVSLLHASALPRQTERRQLRRTSPAGGLFDVRDLPVDASCVDAISDVATLRVQSAWLNAVSVNATPAQIAQLKCLPCVERVEPVRRGVRRDAASTVSTLEHIQEGPYAGRDVYGLAGPQLEQISLPAMHARGYTGAGVIIGVLDTGFRTDHIVFNHPVHPVDIIAAHDFINNDGEVAFQTGDPNDQHVHGTLILSCIGAYEPQRMMGGAYDASFVLAKTEDVASETPIEEDYYVAGLEFIEAQGADVATSSLGYIDWYTQGDLNGVTAVTTIAVNIATENGVHCCTAAGNSGHDANPATSSIIAPADALRVITCGAVGIDGNIAGFSSDGPSADGRVKPEVLACGRSTVCVNPFNTNELVTASGTSLSTPLVASAVACLVQAHPDWTVDQMRAYLFASATDMVATGTHDPLFVRGYGVIDTLGAHLVDYCPADFNNDGGVDGVDIEQFFLRWETGEAGADTNNDGGVDGVDVEVFFGVWEAGGCS